MNHDKWQEVFSKQLAWSDKFLPEQLQRIGDYYKFKADDIAIAEPDADIRDGVDAILPDGRLVALRVRKFGQLMKYKHQFTIRLQANRYGLDEMDKIKAGKLVALHYSFANESDDKLLTGKLLDLDVFRVAQKNWFVGIKSEAKDLDDCKFAAFTIEDFHQYGQIVLDSF